MPCTTVSHRAHKAHREGTTIVQQTPFPSGHLNVSRMNGLTPLFLKRPRKTNCAKEPNSKSTIKMNKIQQEVMHAVHERAQLHRTTSFTQ